MLSMLAMRKLKSQVLTFLSRRERGGYCFTRSVDIFKETPCLRWNFLANSFIVGIFSEVCIRSSLSIDQPSVLSEVDAQISVVFDPFVALCRG